MDGSDLSRFDTNSHSTLQDPHGIPITSEAFIYDYGVVVLWGMSKPQELEFIQEISHFASGFLKPEDQQTEEFNFFYGASNLHQIIYNDVIMLRDPGNYMVKIAISHAIAQSSKISLFEELVDDTIDETKHIPQTLATTGIVKLGRKDISKKIGQLFILRVNVSLVSNILDTPEIFWSEPNFQPLYIAFKGMFSLFAIVPHF
ncbi:Sporulation protein RMD1 [Smittium mucronatum]|uniref:Sporulation protein RMD1 n=1 Tax=Smittium mucronatum TaxID=133383 RepID=A0A1R0GMC0_9FUNG|nr:Sporulation protein RMD1 [Smittium mucronatum]